MIGPATNVKISTNSTPYKLEHTRFTTYHFKCRVSVKSEREKQSVPDYTEKSETESAAPVSDCRRPRAARGGAGLSYSAEGRGTVDETGVAHVYCATQRCEREGGGAG